MFERFRSLFRARAHRRDFEDGMTEELSFHIEQYTEELTQSGLSAAEAGRRARIEFGGRNSIEGDCREARGLYMFDEFDRQLRYAYRLLRDARIHGNCASNNHRVPGRKSDNFRRDQFDPAAPLPFPESIRLVTIFNTYPRAGVDRDGASVTNYYERRGRIPAFASVAIYRYGTAIIGESGSTERQQITRASPDFFSTLGLGPVMGRAFKEEETSYDTDNVVVIADAFWRHNYNADPQIIGKQIRVNGNPTTVIGILPPDFRFLSSEARLYLPLVSRPEDRTPRQRHSGGNSTQMIARLKPGISLAQAQAQIDEQNATLEVDDPQGNMIADAGFRSLVAPLHADHVAAIRPTPAVAAIGRAYPSADRRSQPCRPPYTGAPCRSLLRHSPAAYRHRQLWRIELRGRTAPPRNWRAHGLGNATWSNSQPVLISCITSARFWCDASRIGAWLAGRAMQTVLFHVPAFNLAILSGAAGVMGVVSIVACLLPSHRAARTSPVEALHDS
jgi:hypothetical protein